MFRLLTSSFLALAASYVLAAPSISNTGFETPALSTNQWVSLPQNAQWNFIGVQDRASGIANGSGAWGSGAASGKQYAFIQRDARIEQSVQNLTVGDWYRVKFLMARRNGNVGGNDANQVDVAVGNAVVGAGFRPFNQTWQAFETDPFQATSGSMLLSFRGLQTNLDHTSLIDDVLVESAPAQAPIRLRNGSFENPMFPQGGWSYAPASGGIGWRFDAQTSSDFGSGIASVGSPWGGAAAVGTQFAFIQRGAKMEQELQTLVVGAKYQVRFKLSSRPGFPTHRIRVRINGLEVLAPASNRNGWVDFSTSLFTATASSMTLRFEGLDTGQDAASLIDAVEVVPEPATWAAMAFGIGVLRARRIKARGRLG